MCIRDRINTGRLTAPEGYEVSVPGDVLATPGAGLNVEAVSYTHLIERGQVGC